MGILTYQKAERSKWAISSKVAKSRTWKKKVKKRLNVRIATKKNGILEVISQA
jgi:hypothetical protein